MHKFVQNEHGGCCVVARPRTARSCIEIQWVRTGGQQHRTAPQR